MTQHNASLKADNASLLQRWIDKMNLTAEEMNDEFEKETANRMPGAEDELEGKGKERDFQVGGKT